MKTIIAKEPTARGYIIHYSDGTRENVKTKENPNTILRQTKKLGIKKR